MERRVERRKPAAGGRALQAPKIAAGRRMGSFRAFLAAAGTAAGLVWSGGAAAQAGGADDLERYRRAEVAAEARWPADDPDTGAEYRSALAAFDEATASGDPDHPGFGRAREAWTRLAAGGSAGAAYHLGVLHLYGMGGAAFDQVRAVRLIQEAARNGFPPAQTFLGLLAERGDGTMVLADERLALDWYTHGARGGHCAAVRRLVDAYERGELGAAAAASEAAGWRARLDGCRRR